MVTLLMEAECNHGKKQEKVPLKKQSLRPVGRLIGVVGLKELRSGIENANSGHAKVTGPPPPAKTAKKSSPPPAAPEEGSDSEEEEELNKRD